MKRIDIRYGGERYSISGRDLDSIREEITRLGAAPGGDWLEVNDGDGGPRPSFLLITPGTAVALTPIPEQGDPVDQPQE